MEPAKIDAAIEAAAPDTPKWASVCVATGTQDDPAFAWHHYRDSETSIDFWPASVVKLYTAVASCELLNEFGLPTDSLMLFHRPDDRFEHGWRVEAARMFPEMCSGIFRESTNDDYTMQLRFVGLDRLNGRFFTKGNGFEHTALMRGYVHDPPHVYERQLPQKITVIDPVSEQRVGVEHTWSGTSYAENLGAHVLDSKTGNCSPTRDMVECLRRVLFHEHIPGDERYDLTPDQLELLREGRDGYTGLRNTEYAYGWTDAAEHVFPDARFYHKSGSISTHVLDCGAVFDEASGVRYLFAVATEAKEKGACREISKAIAAWVKRNA